MSQNWCAVCCTRHETGPQCPGELLASGPERFGWRVQVGSKARVEQYAILIAPTKELWRARIVTLPNMLWSVPGGRGTMKFVGRTPVEAEARARKFVLEICARKKYRLLELDSPPEAGAVEEERDPANEAGTAANDKRFLHSVSIRFGVDQATVKASTADLSARGLFVITERPLPKGTKLKMVLETPQATLPLSGTVVWTRAKAEGGRPAGMGVQLQAPPALYIHYVRQHPKPGAQT